MRNIVNCFSFGDRGNIKNKRDMDLKEFVRRVLLFAELKENNAKEPGLNI